MSSLVMQQRTSQVTQLLAPVSSVSHTHTHTCTRTHTHTNTHTLFNVTVVLIYTGIADLFKVKKTVQNIVNWMDLGLALGLLYPTLQKIDSEKRGKVDDCMREMLAAWLQQQDNVSQVGAPSWSVLQTALRNIGANELADIITTQW